MKTMRAKPEYLRATVTGRPVEVDRKAEILRGFVVAQEGPFKSDGRGEFDELSLQQVIKLGNAARGGVKSRFTHPDMSSDGLGKFLGRAHEFTMATALDARTGKKVKAVRADLHFDASAHDTPNGDLAGYVMTLAENDPDALSSSMVVRADEEYRLRKDGTPELGPDDEPLPPLWRLTALHASDIVDTGDAVDSLLSADQLAKALSVGITPELEKALKWDNVVRLSSQLLDGLFAGQTRDVVEARCEEYLKRYLSRRFGGSDPVESSPTVATPRIDALSLRVREMALVAEKIRRNV